MKVELTLKGYITPSPNSTRWAHWRVAYREKQEAARALMSALCDAQRESLKNTTTSQEVAKQSLIASAILNLLPMIPKKLSRSTSVKRKLLTAKITKLSSL